MGKIRVEELAAQMGIGSKEVLFLLQSIGVDVKSPQAALDESTVLSILQGKTHAPKQLIVRDNEARAARPQKSALNRIKIVEKAPASAESAETPAEPEAPAPPRRHAAEKVAAKPAEPARTAVVPAEPEPEAPPPPPTKPPAPQVPRKIVLPPKPVAPPRPTGPAASGVRPTGATPSRPMGPSGGPARPMGPAAEPRGRWDRRAGRWGRAPPDLPSIARLPAAPARDRWAGPRGPARRWAACAPGCPSAVRSSARRTTSRARRRRPASAARVRRSPSPTRSICASSSGPIRKTRTRTFPSRSSRRPARRKPKR